MEFPSTSLVLTKIRPPAARPGTVERARLLEKLAPDAVTDLVLICAPAGYGKTTLLVEWVQQLRSQGTAAAWVSLDEGDNNPALFAAYLAAALSQALGPGSGIEQVSQVLRVSPETDLTAILPAVINTVWAADRDLALVLDDFHLIHNPAVLKALDFLISRRPANLHLAIGSRSTPALPLARLRARGRLVELHAADLRFSENETERFFRESMRLDVPVELSRRLAGQVEGWAAGLQLAALSLVGRSPQEMAAASLSGSQRNVAEYLLEEVVNRLPERLQSFLLYTSVLERLSAPLCDAILKTDDSAVVLRSLEQANLFVIGLDQEGTWFRYHHLFRDFLLTWLSRTQPEQAEALHRSACTWLAGQGYLREAAYHAFRSGSWAFAADFVEQHSFTQIIQSDIASIYEWCAAFPESVMRVRPKLCVFQGLALAYRFQGKNRARVEARLQQAAEMLPQLADPEQVFEIGELAAVVQTFLAMTPDPHVDARMQLKLAEARLSAYPSGDPGRFSWLLINAYAHLALYQPDLAEAELIEAFPLARQSGLFFGMVEVTFHRARLAHSLGRLAESLEICRMGREELAEVIPPAAAGLPAVGCLDVAEGCIWLEMDRLREAEPSLRRGLELMGWGMHPSYLMTAYLALFRLYQIKGQPVDAKACLDQLAGLWPDISLILKGFQVDASWRAHPGSAEVKRAVETWLQEFSAAVGGDLPLAGSGPVGAAEAYYQAGLIWMRLQAAVGRASSAQPYLDQQLQAARTQGMAGRVIELELIEAQVLVQAENAKQALEVAARAVSSGLAAGYMRVFDQGPILDDLLIAAYRRGMLPPGCEQTMPVLRMYAARQPETHPAAAGEEWVEALSQRELEVLRMVATGATNQEIAEHFVITVGTVKSHLNHILGKLGVGNRTEAAAVARKLGLLADDGGKIEEA